MKASYTALVIDPTDRAVLLRAFPAPAGWTPYCHHMTCNMGGSENGPAAAMIGQKASATVVAFAQDEKVMAVQVESSVPSNNAVKHITVAVNRAAGGKPFQSNSLKNWQPVQRVTVNGTVVEVGQGDVVISH